MTGFDSAEASESMTLKMWMSNMHVGTVIGKGGVNIKGIREQSECKVSIAEMAPGSTERLVSITGGAMAISRATELMLDVLEAAPGKDGAEPVPSADQTHALKIVLSNNQVGGVIGKAGATIKQMREESGATIKVESAATVQSERLAQIGGAKVACVKAVTLLASKLATMPPDDSSSTPGKVQKTGLPAARAGAPGQFQGGPGYPGMQPQPGYPGMQQQFQAPGQSFPGQQQHGQGFQSPGFQQQQQQPGFQQGGYAQQGYAGFGVDGSQGSYGGAPAAASGPSGSMEQMVPVQLVGRLIGRGGSGIKELRDMTGASIKVNSDCEPGTDQRKVVVSGTPEQTQVALSLIQQRLAMGP